MPCSGFALGRRLVSPWGVWAGFQRVGASKKAAPTAPPFCLPPLDGGDVLCGRLLHAVFLAELVHTAGGIDQFYLAGVEGVRSGGDFQFYQRVSYSVDLYRVAGVGGGVSDERFAVGHVAECAKSVIFGMDTFFHRIFEFFLFLIFCVLPEIGRLVGPFVSRGRNRQGQGLARRAQSYKYFC